MTNWPASRANGGIAAAKNPPITAGTSTMTVRTAAHRGNQRRVSTDTTDSRPIARNKAKPISTSIPRAVMIIITSPAVTATPAAAPVPVKNADLPSRGAPG